MLKLTKERTKIDGRAAGGIIVCVYVDVSLWLCARWMEEKDASNVDTANVCGSSQSAQAKNNAHRCVRLGSG